jgi:NAD-dependent dihydropyrimidine dehydrogenase PreA subunit
LAAETAHHDFPALNPVPKAFIPAKMLGSVELCRHPGDNDFMTYVIAEPCIGTKDTACVDACPVDCIHPKKDEPAFGEEEMLYIDPVECIDCGACVPVCPVSAIFALDDLPEKWAAFTERNAKYYGR